MCIREVVLLGLLTIFTAATSVGQEVSGLWGHNGEKWAADSRLPDFSFAGYHFGEDPLPRVPVVSNVIDFGATPNDQIDDTAAFKRVIEKTDSGAILIPAGRYLLSDILWLKKSNIVLRGEGPENTELFFTKELEDVRPNMGSTTSGKTTSNYSWSGGFLWAKGYIRTGPISKIGSGSKRGERVLKLEKPGKVRVGQRVRVELHDDAEKSLLTYLYSGDPGDLGKINKPVSVHMTSRVAAVNGIEVTLERPLRWDLREEWRPKLTTYQPTVSEVGIEDLSIGFPAKPYAGHFTERGMNGIALNAVSDSWVRNVRISNCDSGVSGLGSFCTIDGLVLDGSRKSTKGDTGHHGVTMGQDSLMMNFDFRTKFIHDLTLSYQHAGNVIKNGRGDNLSFDHHKRAPHDNLFCNIDVGHGGQVWRCGGGKQLGKNCGARGTFWCIYSKNRISWPPARFGPPSMNVVGVNSSDAPDLETSGKWFEPIPPEHLQPADLHAAQLDRRLRSSKGTLNSDR